MNYRFAMMLTAVVLAGCQVFRGADVPATRQAENIAYIAEATSIPRTHQAEAAAVLGTVQAEATYVAQQEAINLALALTVRAGDPPTIERIVGNAPGTAGTPGSGEMQFVEIQTASAVRDSDGCADAAQSQFTADTPQIYVTARVLSIRSGTRMDAEWRYEGEVVWQDSWTVPADAENFCLWFYVDSSEVSFSPGNWSVRLYADGVSIAQAATFTIIQ